MKKIILLLMMCIAFSTMAYAQLIQRPNRNATETVVFVVKGDGIDCQGCYNRINQNISRARGVTDVIIDMEYDLVIVTFRPRTTSIEQLKAVFTRINFAVEVIPIVLEEEEEEAA